MKKLLLSTAIAGVAFAASPAYAQLELDIGGYFKGYGVYADHDEGTSATDEKANELDFIRDTEVHLGAETVLDNGLTVGAHFEFDVDGTDSATTVDETYVYFSGGWGRVNFGDEDGAAYLLQVAAPSADSNYDGIRQYVQPFNYDVLLADTAVLNDGPGGGTAALTDAQAAAVISGGLDYDQDITGKSTKLTYLSPIYNGFQAGLTFTPDSNGDADDLEGVGLESVVNTFGMGYEAAARWEGMFNNVGIILGAGYSWTELEARDFDPDALGDPTDDRRAYNFGVDFDFGPFGLGMAYLNDNQGEVLIDGAGAATDVMRNADEEEIYVFGADYTTGPFKIGASYYNSENTGGFDGLESDRYTGGVIYQYGPGMSFRGSVTHVDHEGRNGSNLGGTDDNQVDATGFLLGTQINF